MMEDLTTEDIKNIREKLMKNYTQMGKLFGVSSSTWKNWEEGVVPIPSFKEKLIRIKNFLLTDKVL